MIICIFAKKSKTMINPFVTTGYVGPEYFCDREKETCDIVSLLTNGNNIALISSRRVGKTDLLRHCMEQPEIKDKYYTFIVDIYSTRSLSDFVNTFGKVILEELKPRGKRVWSKYVNMLSSLKTGISYDNSGTPSWMVSLGDLNTPQTTLEEIFGYIQNADKRCIVIIDEFQQVLKYPENNIEAIIRTYMQYCRNANFVFSGSHRHLMGSIFTSPARPFYQSVTIMDLPLIDKQRYLYFCMSHFKNGRKALDADVVENLYDEFEGVTFYLQKVMNILYMQTKPGAKCKLRQLKPAIDYIVDFTSGTYEDLLYQLPDKQKRVLLAISKAGKAINVTSGSFTKKYGLISPSSVNSAIKGLLEKDLLTQNKGVYQVYDKFFERWLIKKF